MILQDETLTHKAKELIMNEKVDCVYAIEKGIGEIITNFKNIPDEYIAERAKDIEDIKNMLNNIDFICPVKWKGNRQAEYEYEREYSVYDITLRRYDASIEEALSELNEAKNNISQQIDDCKGKIAKTIGLI